MQVELTKPQSDFFLSEAIYPLFIGGYGSGKTFVKLTSALNDLLNNPGARVGLYDPTYDLIKLNTAPRMEAMLDDIGITHKYNKSENIIYVQGYGEFIMRSMDNPNRIVGYEVFRSHVDELETLITGRIPDVWNKVIARNRQVMPSGEKNRVSVYTTPDAGFGFTYDRWHKNKIDGYEYYRAPTASNKYLPEDYIDNLRATYPQNLVDAFIDGRWVNLKSGTVYQFDRTKHCTDVDIQGFEPLHIGMDFNVRNMNAVIFTLKDKKADAVAEITGVIDTPKMIDVIKDRYSRNSIIIYPDASGKNTSSKSASLSDIGLLRSAGFTINAPNKNPNIKDRIISVNAGLEHGKIRVNVNNCPSLSAALEQQGYDKNGMPDKNPENNIDDIADAAGYFIHRALPAVKPNAASTLQIIGGY